MDSIEIVDRSEFEREIAQLLLTKNGHRTAYNRDQFNNLIESLLQIQNGAKKMPIHYYYEKRYKLVVIDGSTYHVCLKSVPGLIYLIPVEEYYEKLLEAHLGTAHGGRDRMHYYCRDRWVIAKSACQLFASMCSTCNRKRIAPTKGVVIKPILSKGFNARGQVDLIDLQSCPDGKCLLIFLKLLRI